MDNARWPLYLWRELSLVKSEAQPLRITADTEPAKPWFVSWDLCRSPQTAHIGDRYFEVRDAEEHQKTSVRIASWTGHYS